MHKGYSKQWRGAVAAALLAFSLAGCDFISPTESNPNVVPDATLNQLLVAAQVLSYYWNESDNSRFPAVWMQQMDGTDRQFSAYSTYVFTNEQFNPAWDDVYTGGGLVDIRRSIVAAEANGNRVLAGIFKVHEAYFGGAMANTYGDIPWSQSTDPEITQPAFDGQLEVFSQVQTLLDAAISDLGGGGLGPASGVDFSFDGDGSAWVTVAHSLKARYYMATAEADAASYGRALAEARQGIQSNAGNWTAHHSTIDTEHNIWNQFNRERTAYISAGAHLVDLLKDRADPRLPIYFTVGVSGEFEGSPPGEDDPDDPAVNASQMNSVRGSPGAQDFPLPIITCSETRFIEAEAAFQTGDEAGARSALQAGITCQADSWGVVLPAVSSGLSGQALLAAIMEEKYIAQFLNPDTWSDWKRTCLPALVGWRATTIPARYLYPSDERLTNENVPPDPPTGRNANDPQGC